MGIINDLNDDIKKITDKYKRFSSEQLKTAALIFMILDHIGYGLGDSGSFLRAIGRLAFPIFAFLIAEGFRHTSDRKKYLVRMLVFAIVSEIPFNLMLNGSVFLKSNQNVMFTYMLGIIMLMFIEEIRLRITDFAKEALAEMGIIFLFCLISGMARTDYYVTGILMIWIFYRWADDYVTEILLYVMLFIMQAELTGIGAIVLILMYNGNLSNRHRSIGEKLIIKYFFYVMYPLHMIILALIFGRIGL